MVVHVVRRWWRMALLTDCLVVEEPWQLAQDKEKVGGSKVTDNCSGCVNLRSKVGG